MRTKFQHSEYVSVGRNLRQARKDAGLTQHALGQRVGKATSTIHHYEMASRKIPLPVLTKFAEIFKTDISSLLSESQSLVDQDSTATKIDGRLGTRPKEDRDFDVLLVYFPADEPAAESIAKHLKDKNINVWVQFEKVRPSQLTHGVILQAISNAKTAAIIFGPESPDAWEIRKAVNVASRCIQDGMEVIPIMLPGTDRIPDDLAPIEGGLLVKFKDSVTDDRALATLEWGITGNRREQ